MHRNMGIWALAAFAAAVNAQSTRATRVGDVHVYTVQQKADRALFEETVTVTSIEGDRIKTSHVRSDRPAPIDGLYGKDWGTYRSGSSGLQFEPPSRVLSLPLEVGKTWETAYEATTPTGVKLRVKMRSDVKAQEKLNTPAGEFDTFRIDSTGYLNGVSFQGGWGILQKIWYAPAIDRIVRLEYKEQRATGADNVSELKSFKPAD